MRIRLIFLMTMLMCFGCCTIDDSYSESSDCTIKKHYEILQIWEDHNKRERDDYLNKYPQAKKYIGKPGHVRVTPLMIGPLTIEQIEYKLLEITGKSPVKNAPKRPFNYGDDNWNEVLNKYQNGDEFYYYKDDAREYIPFSGMKEGFILIRENEYIGEIVIASIIQ